jgi:hypothetical protein
VADLIPSISVVIPNYNRADLIGETLESMLRQSRAPAEVIVVDDGSADGSVEEIARFGSRVRLIRQENAGPAAARNRGLAAASGAYVQFLDSDDLCSLNKLEVQAGALDRTGADIAYGPWLQTRLEHGLARHPEPALQQQALPADRPALSWFLQGWVIVFQCCLFRRSLIDRVGPYRTDLFIAEDLELLFRMLRAGGRTVHTPEAMTVYRLHDGGQISRGGIAEQRRAEHWLHYVIIVAEAIKADPAGTTPADRREWRMTVWDAHRQLAALGGAGGSMADGAAMELLAFRVRKLLRRWRAGLGRRTGGSSFTRPFGAGPLTAHQRDLLKALGYDPVLDAAARG